MEDSPQNLQFGSKLGPAVRPYAGGGTFGRVRLAELVGTFSLATDAGMGVPEEHGLRAAAVAVRLGQLAGVDEATKRQAFYLTLLRYTGCREGRDQEENEPPPHAPNAAAHASGAAAVPRRRLMRL